MKLNLWFLLEGNKDILSVIHRDQEGAEPKRPDEMTNTDILLQDILGKVALVYIFFH
jgi:hypothetical protein